MRSPAFSAALGRSLRFCFSSSIHNLPRGTTFSSCLHSEALGLVDHVSMATTTFFPSLTSTSSLRNTPFCRQFSTSFNPKLDDGVASSLLLKRSRLQRRALRLTQNPIQSSLQPVQSEEILSSLTPLERLRGQQLLNEGVSFPTANPQKANFPSPSNIESGLPSTFDELGLSEELLAAANDLKLVQPTEIQALGIPSVLRGETAVLASHTGSGKTLAYLLPLVQLLRKDELESGRATKPRKPRAFVLCPTRELAEQVLQVAKSICHHARFRSAMISGGGRMRPQQDALNTPLDLVVGTPGRLMMHIKEGNLSYSDVKYVVLDEADTMFDRGFGPDVRKILLPLRSRSKELGGLPFQTLLVTATITKSIQRLLDEEFPGIHHIRTSSLHKKVATARHDFLPVAGNENKLDTVAQVLQTSLAKGHRIMVFCNTIQSCRAVDYFLNDNNIETVNYHGEVPASERVENLNRFRGTLDETEDMESDTFGRIPVLVCTDLAARGLDLTVDHVIMFDFPQNSIDYLHRTGRTARMGAKGKITSLVTKRDYILSKQIETAISKGGSLENLTNDRGKMEAMKKDEIEEKRKLKGKFVKGDGTVRSFNGKPIFGSKIDTKYGSKMGTKFGPKFGSPSRGRGASKGIVRGSQPGGGGERGEGGRGERGRGMGERRVGGRGEGERGEGERYGERRRSRSSERTFQPAPRKSRGGGSSRGRPVRSK